MRFITLCLLGVAAAAAAPASPQAPPATEVYLAALTSAAGAVTVGPPANISNNPAYDNQPSFLPDSSAVLFTSIRDGKPTDIYRYDLASKQLSQVTHTEENEYSPLVTPDGKTFSVVRGADQKLWRFNLDGSNPQLVYAHTGLIGYHVWIDAGHLAVFVLGAQGQPATLQLIDLATKKAEVVDTNIGRSLLMRPGQGTLTYISTKQADAWTVNELNLQTHAITTLVQTPGRSQDCAWTPDGALLMGRGATLLMWRPGASGWIEIANLSSAGLDAVTRLAVSRDGRWLAIVAQPKSAATR